MRKKIVSLFIILLVIIPLNVKALSSDYIDVVKDITKTETEEDKVSLYLFYGAECPHCEEEREWLEDFKKEYKDYLNVYELEVWHNKRNQKSMEKVSDKLDANADGVPFTIVGDSYFVGFSSTTKSQIENKVKSYAGLSVNVDEITIPLIGKVNIKNVSLPIVAIILGFIDGFNPCAMWILLFLINMLYGMKDRKKMWILGLTFLFVSALVYFLSMLGINFVLGIATISYMKIILGIFILSTGIYNLYKYFKSRKEEVGCDVVDNKKRKKIMSKMKKIMSSKSFIIALVGIIALATSVNLIELACSLGFPVIFTTLLSINNITGITKIIYLLVYILFYMIDDLVVFAISMITLQATGITNKYNKICKIISAIIMIVMGLLLIFKPDWLMLNF